MASAAATPLASRPCSPPVHLAAFRLAGCKQAKALLGAEPEAAQRAPTEAGGSKLPQTLIYTLNSGVARFACVTEVRGANTSVGNSGVLIFAAVCLCSLLWAFLKQEWARGGLRDGCGMQE